MRPAVEQRVKKPVQSGFWGGGFLADSATSAQEIGGWVRVGPAPTEEAAYKCIISGWSVMEVAEKSI